MLSRAAGRTGLTPARWVCKGGIKPTFTGNRKGVKKGGLHGNPKVLVRLEKQKSTQRNDLPKFSSETPPPFPGAL